MTHARALVHPKRNVVAIGVRSSNSVSRVFCIFMASSSTLTKDTKPVPGPRLYVEKGEKNEIEVSMEVAQLFAPVKAIIDEKNTARVAHAFKMDPIAIELPGCTTDTLKLVCGIAQEYVARVPKEQRNAPPTGQVAPWLASTFRTYSHLSKEAQVHALKQVLALATYLKFQYLESAIVALLDGLERPSISISARFLRLTIDGETVEISSEAAMQFKTIRDMFEDGAFDLESEEEIPPLPVICREADRFILEIACIFAEEVLKHTDDKFYNKDPHDPTYRAEPLPEWVTEILRPLNGEDSAQRWQNAGRLFVLANYLNFEPLLRTMAKYHAMMIQECPSDGEMKKWFGLPENYTFGAEVMQKAKEMFPAFFEQSVSEVSLDDVEDAEKRLAQGSDSMDVEQSSSSSSAAGQAEDGAESSKRTCTIDHSASP